MEMAVITTRKTTDCTVYRTAILRTKKWNQEFWRKGWSRWTTFTQTHIYWEVVVLEGRYFLDQNTYLEGKKDSLSLNHFQNIWPVENHYFNLTTWAEFRHNCVNYFVDIATHNTMGQQTSILAMGNKKAHLRGPWISQTLIARPRVARDKVLNWKYVCPTPLCACCF